MSAGSIAGDAPLLQVAGLSAGYGKRRVLEDVTLELAPRQIVAVIGPNGCGKSTLLKAIFGLCQLYHGTITFNSTDITSLAPHKRPAIGIAYLPQGKHAFDDLSVRENLLLGGYTLPRAELEARVASGLDDYPKLKPMLRRPAYTLSGGERQMLALARALIMRPRLLLLDEPSVGLAPKLSGEVLNELIAVRNRLGTTILVVEQKVEQVLQVADYAIGMRLGKIACLGTPMEVAGKARELFLI